MVEAPQTGAEGCAIEVHEKSRGISRDFHIGDHLREARRVKQEIRRPRDNFLKQKNKKFLLIFESLFG
jgi:hypothetical protein